MKGWIKSMTDNPLDNAFDQAVSDATPVTEVQAEVVESVPEVEPEQPQKPQEDTFTHVDPETLPEELKGIYKSLVADYTRKRQAESKRVKELEGKLQALESGANQVQSPQVVDENLTPEDRSREIARQTFREEQERVWIDQAKGDYIRLDERLDDNNPVTHDPKLDSWLQVKLDDELAQHEAETGSKLSFNYKERAKELIKEWDEYISSLNLRFVEKQKQMAKEQANKSARLSPDVSSAKGKPSQGKVSLDDAFDSALSGE